MRRKARLWDAGWLGFDHSWQLQLIKQWGGNRTWVKGCSAWKCVYLWLWRCNLLRFPCQSGSCTSNSLNFLPNHTTVPPWTENRLYFWLLFDTSVLLQFGKRGWTDLLSRAPFLSVFHLRDQQPSDERYFSLPKRKKNPTSEKHTPHLEYKINSNWDTLKLVVGWNKGCMFLPLYCRDIEWWMINDEPK